MIVVWKNDGNSVYAGQEVEFFKVSWSGLGWLRDPDGPYWGIEHPVFDRNIRLVGEPKHYGTVKKEPGRSPEIEVIPPTTRELTQRKADNTNISVPSLVFGRPVLGVIDEEE